MTTDTRKTIIRHLKGIVAALEKDGTIEVLGENKPKHCEVYELSDRELRNAFMWADDPKSPNYNKKIHRDLKKEMKSRGITF